MIEILTRAKNHNRDKIRKKKVKLFLFADSMILSLNVPINSVKNLLDRINTNIVLNSTITKSIAQTTVLVIKI